MTKPIKVSRRGFASMDPAKRREIASQGGRAAHAKGKAHQFSHEEVGCRRQEGRRSGTRAGYGA